MTTPTAPVTITVAARTLRMMLAGVLPHAAVDDTLPTLQAVKIEARGCVLYLATTDRYSMAAARCPIPGAIHSSGPEVDALIDCGNARKLFELLAGRDGAAALVIDPAKHKLTADVSASRPVDPAWETWDTIPLDKREWPTTQTPWRKMLYGLLEAKAATLDDGFGVDMRILARFGQIDRAPFAPYYEEDEPEPEWPEEGARLRVVQHGKAGGPAVLVTRGQWFIGAAMGAQLNKNDAAGESAYAPSWDDWAATCAPSDALPARSS